MQLLIINNKFSLDCSGNEEEADDVPKLVGNFEEVAAQTEVTKVEENKDKEKQEPNKKPAKKKHQPRNQLKKSPNRTKTRAARRNRSIVGRYKSC